MLFHVEMCVHLPDTLDPATVDRLKESEKAMSQAFQRSGVWRHLWRLVGCYANISIFDVESPAQLHDLLTKLPLFPYMDITVRALCQHPSAIVDEEIERPQALERPASERSLDTGNEGVTHG
jgi:muconolactone D-isomerase